MSGDFGPGTKLNGGKTIKELDKKFHKQAVKDNKSWEASKQEEKKRILELIDEEVKKRGDVYIDAEELKKEIKK